MQCARRSVRGLIFLSPSDLRRGILSAWINRLHSPWSFGNSGIGRVNLPAIELSTSSANNTWYRVHRLFVE